MVQICSETVFIVSSLLLDDTFQPVTPLIDGVVNEAMRQFAPPREFVMMMMMIARLSCSTEVNRRATVNELMKGTQV